MTKTKTKTTTKIKTKKNKKNKTKTVKAATTITIEQEAPGLLTAPALRRARAKATPPSSSLHVLASGLNKHSSDGEVIAVLKSLVQKKVEPIAQDRVLSAIKEATGIRLRPLREQLAAIARARP
jgi:hypothetical protein